MVKEKRAEETAQPVKAMAHTNETIFSSVEQPWVSKAKEFTRESKMAGL